MPPSDESSSNWSVSRSQSNTDRKKSQTGQGTCAVRLRSPRYLQRANNEPHIIGIQGPWLAGHWYPCLRHRRLLPTKPTSAPTPFRQRRPQPESLPWCNAGDAPSSLSILDQLFHTPWNGTCVAPLCRSPSVG
ncbi:hypothetical protein M422DRAFT_243742 [Sphaerobolus stellatus SS14]|nr:hypothetical protein M422DRAFT_243742 [Sphaerobolus stellatus SS14]